MLSARRSETIPASRAGGMRKAASTGRHHVVCWRLRLGPGWTYSDFGPDGPGLPYWGDAMPGLPRHLCARCRRRRSTEDACLKNQMTTANWVSTRPSPSSSPPRLFVASFPSQSSGSSSQRSVSWGVEVRGCALPGELGAALGAEREPSERCGPALPKGHCSCGQGLAAGCFTVFRLGSGLVQGSPRRGGYVAPVRRAPIGRTREPHQVRGSGRGHAVSSNYSGCDLREEIAWGTSQLSGEGELG
jgi:hypothetical protein